MGLSTGLCDGVNCFFVVSYTNVKSDKRKYDAVF